jgi:hypothetical protein
MGGKILTFTRQQNHTQVDNAGRINYLWWSFSTGAGEDSTPKTQILSKKILF